MLPESRGQRTHLRLTFNRSLSEPGQTVAASGPLMSSMIASSTSSMERHQKRLYLHLHHHHHLHHHVSLAPARLADVSLIVLTRQSRMVFRNQLGRVP